MKAAADMPYKYHKAPESVLNGHAALFGCQFGRTNATKHVIYTSDVTPKSYYPVPSFSIIQNKYGVN